LTSSNGSDSKSHERELEIANSLVLKYGVILSCSLIAIGLLIAFIREGQSLQITIPQLLQSNLGKPSFDAATLVSGITHLNGICIVEVGVLILLATPVFRVAVTTVMFLVERNMEYTVIGMFVLAVLLFSLFVVGPYVATSHI
jgi:uncharacterized membrane protein